MFVHLLATFAMGAIGAGFVYLVARPFGWKVPTFVYPLAAAVGMLGYSIYDEYSWYSRASSALPTRLKVVRSYATSMPYQPWTYAVPRVYRFDAVDLGSTRNNPNAPDLTLVQLIRVTRNTSSVNVSAIADCKNERFAEVDQQTTFAENGLPTNAKWLSLGSHPALRQVICNSA